MKLLVDGFNIGLDRGTGIATYGRGFIRAAHDLGHETTLLLGLDEADGQPTSPMRKLIDFGTAPFGYSPGPVSINMVAKRRDLQTLPVDAIVNRRRLYRAARGAFNRTGLFTPVRLPGIDIAHWTYPLPLYVPGACNVYTIHDAVPIQYPEMSPGGQDYLRICAAIARRGNPILTVSERSRADLIASLGVDPALIMNSYQAVDGWETLPPRTQGLPTLLRTHNLRDRGYFLFFGAIEPKKNVAMLLRAFEAAAVDTPLVLVAAGGWDNSVEREELARLTTGAHPRVLHVDYLPRHDLVTLIRHAKATLFPSLYEGFGLPAIESMALGTPVITSDRGALPEVVGDAAIIINPLSLTSIRNAIRMIDSDPDLAARMAMRGLERACLFSQKAYQARIGAILERLIVR